jgi:hypothetical protein
MSTDYDETYLPTTLVPIGRQNATYPPLDDDAVCIMYVLDLSSYKRK